MVKWQKTETGYIREIDGNIEKHPYLYLDHAGVVFRAEYKDGQCISVEKCPVKSYLVVNKATGDIVFHNTGFQLEVELGRDPACPPGCEIVWLEASAPCPHCGGVENKKHHETVPPDFIENKEITYRCKNGKLEKKA